MNGEQPHERAICGAKTRAGTPCKRAPRANGRCNLHGGKSLTGAAVPHFRDGRHSKYLPQQLRDRYQQAISDPDLLALRDEIALIDTRVSGLFDPSGDVPSADQWAEIVTMLEARRRLVETERRRLVDLQQMMTAEQAMTFVAAVVDIVRRHVSDRTALAGISAELTQLSIRGRG